VPLLLFLNGKGNPILKITTLLRLRKPVDVIILEDIHFLKILGVWLKEIQLPDQGYEIRANLIPLSLDGMR
jgi:hypothetical protein